MKPRYTWKKGKDRSGMMRLAKTYSLRRGGEELATAQQDSESQLWFWYGGGHNSLWSGGKCAALEDVKAEAVAYFKAREEKETS